MQSSLYASYETMKNNKENQIMTFEGINVEVFEFRGQVLFNPKDVADCLDIKNVNDAIKGFSNKQKVKLTNSIIGNTDFRKLHNTGENFLTESGVYKLIFKSRKEEAERFQDWITDEVLPAIRKTGGYIGNTEEMSEEEIMAKALMVAQRTIEKKNQELIAVKEELRVLQPKAIFADAVSASQTSILVGELAKILKQNGVNTGGTRLFSWLRENGYLIKRRGTDYNMPTQKSMELGLFEIKETNVVHSDGHVSISKTPKVTGKGQVYFINKFKSVKQLSYS